MHVHVRLHGVALFEKAGDSLPCEGKLPATAEPTISLKFTHRCSRLKLLDALRNPLDYTVYYMVDDKSPQLYPEGRCREDCPTFVLKATCLLDRRRLRRAGRTRTRLRSCSTARASHGATRPSAPTESSGQTWCSWTAATSPRTWRCSTRASSCWSAPTSAASRCRTSSSSGRRPPAPTTGRASGMPS